MSDNHRTRFLILTLVVICSIVIAARAVTPNVAAAAAAGTTTAAAVPGAGITSGMLDFIPPNLFSEDFIASLNDYATKVSELVPPSVYEFATRWTQVITIALTPALEMIQKQIQLSKVGPTLEFWLAFAEDYTTLYPRTVLYIALGAVAALLLSVVSPVLCSSRRGSDVPQGADAETYLIDFATYKPPAHLYVTKERWAALNDFYKWAPEDLEFQFKLLDRSGLGDTTAFPDSLMSRPPKINIAAAREEAEIVMFTILDELFARNNLNPKDVDILIVNCSLFNPTPSLSAMIINRYGMRPNIMSYNLSGMGCSAGVISIALARDLMRVHKNVNVIVVSTENITQNIYLGKDKAMLISNTLFRMGGACLYLSNRRAVRHRAR